MHALSDFEHVDIINKRLIGELSMHRIAEAISRSPYTVMKHIHDHNEGVRMRGHCLRCRRIKATGATEEA